MKPYPPNQKTVRKRAKVHIVVVIRVITLWYTEIVYWAFGT